MKSVDHHFERDWQVRMRAEAKEYAYRVIQTNRDKPDELIGKDRR